METVYEKYIFSISKPWARLSEYMLRLLGRLQYMADNCFARHYSLQRPVVIRHFTHGIYIIWITRKYTAMFIQNPIHPTKQWATCEWSK